MCAVCVLLSPGRGRVESPHEDLKAHRTYSIHTSACPDASPHPVSIMSGFPGNESPLDVLQAWGPPTRPRRESRPLCCSPWERAGRGCPEHCSETALESASYLLGKRTVLSPCCLHGEFREGAICHIFIVPHLHTSFRFVFFPSPPPFIPNSLYIYLFKKKTCPELLLAYLIGTAVSVRTGYALLQ